MSSELRVQRFKTETPNSELITPNYSKLRLRRIDRFLYQKEKSIGKRILLFPLYLLSFPYGGVVRDEISSLFPQIIENKNPSLPGHQRREYHGGRNRKTPLVMAIAKGLMERGNLRSDSKQRV